MRRIALPTLFVAALLVCATSVEAQHETIYVDDDGPADFATIQEAIDAAAEEDTVLVAPGTYTGDGNRDIDFRGKAITLRSEQGPESCVIDCGGPYPAYVHWPGRRDGSGRRGGDPEPHDYHRAFYFHSHQAANTLVQGFTVTGGVAMDETWTMTNGGAFHCVDSRLTIRNCIIVSNAAELGGGIYAQDSHIRIEHCAITENKAYDDLTSGGTGGGAWISGGEVRFSNCRIAANVASGGGGGIACEGSHQFINCTVTGNRAYPYGRGGGILFGPGSEQDTSYLLNSVVWGNMESTSLVGFTADDVVIISGVMLGTMSVKTAHSFIGAVPNLVDDDMIGQWPSGDPLFAAPGRWDPNELASAPWDDFWVDGDYHLRSQAGRWDQASGSWVQDEVTSPCIDAGDPNSPIMHEPFPHGGVVNMGAYGGTGEASMSPMGEPTAGRWTEPAPLFEVNTATAEEWAPILSTDGLALYFGRVRSPESSLGRIFQATRASLADAFVSIVEVPGPLNDADGDVLCPWVSPDGLRMYYNFQSGTVFRLQVSERSSTTDPWPLGTDIWELNALDTRLHTPRLTEDELTIFFTGPDLQGGAGYDLWMATRPDRDAQFDEPVNLTRLNTADNDIHASPCCDGLTVYFASNRNGRYQLFRSMRPSADSPFGPPVHMTPFDTPGTDSMFPYLSPDGTEFYFMRQTAGGRATRDIYVAYRID